METNSNSNSKPITMEKNPVLRDKMLRDYAMQLLAAGYRGVEAYITPLIHISTTECQLITGSIVKYDGFAADEVAKLHYSDKKKWFLLGYGKTYSHDGKRVIIPQEGWFYVLR